MQLDAIPQNISGVDGAHEELEKKFSSGPQDVADRIKDIDCFSQLVALCEKHGGNDNQCKCRKLKEEAEDGALVVFFIS